jgi:tetratricopeptide (TPR) repeat protein
MTTNASATPLLSLHQISLYNTGRMTPEQVIAAFAARRQQFERIVADIAAEKPKSRAQHHLIVGQRGMGKTMLLARIAAELRTDSNLSARFIPLVFVEEQYAVDRLSKFWLNCLDSLADAREFAGDATGVDEIDTAVARLTAAGMRAAKDDQPFADEIYGAFAELAKASGQRPVLLVDNLQLVFERLDEGQQHSLRELLMRPGSPILVGASPSPPSPTTDYSAAFYDQFKVHYLRPLDESEMRSLLVHLADVADRDDVRQRVLQHPARLTVLRQLTGGNPRTTLTLFFLYAEDFAPSVFGDLEGLLDRVTPLYKARFEELTPQQQVIASAIANHWDPVTAATVAATTGLPAGTISAQLDRLEKTGFIERTELFGETRTGYQLAERFFNIWFLMRSASRRQRREVEFLTRFLETFYEPLDRNRLARHLMGEDRFSPDRYVWSRAVADSLTEPEAAEDLRRHAELTALREEVREARARLRELIDFDSLPSATLAFGDLRKTLASLVPDNSAVAGDDFAKAVLGDRAMFMSGEREQLAARPGKLGPDEIQSVLETIRTARVADEKTYSVDAVDWFSQRLASGQIRSLEDAEDWNRAFHQAAGKQVNRLMVTSLPYEFGTLISDSSLARIHEALEPRPSAPALQWYNWGWHLFKLGRDGEAELAYRTATARDADFAAPWNNLGNVLRRQYRFDEAEAAYRQAIAIDPQDAMPWNNLGNLLCVELNRLQEAEAAYGEAIKRNPEYDDAWNNLGNLYCDHLSLPSDAAKAYDNALRLNATHEVPHHNRLFLRRDFMGEGARSRPLMDELRVLPALKLHDTVHLHEALFAAYDANWGLASEAMAKALTIRAEGFSALTTDDWLRASAVLLHLNYGAELLTFLDQRGDTARLRPWVEALRAHHLGDRRALRNIAPEIRSTAEFFYDGIESRLKNLPEKTRRRPLPKPKRTRSKRHS